MYVCTCVRACLCACARTCKHVMTIVEVQQLCGVSSLLLSWHGFRWLNSGHHTCAASGKWFSLLSHLSCPCLHLYIPFLRKNTIIFSVSLQRLQRQNIKTRKIIYVSSEVFLDSYGTLGLLESRILNISFSLSKQLEGRVSGWGFSHPYVGSFREHVALMCDMLLLSKSIRNIKTLLLSVLSLESPLMILPDLARTQTKSTLWVQIVETWCQLMALVRTHKLWYLLPIFVSANGSGAAH